MKFKLLKPEIDVSNFKILSSYLTGNTVFPLKRTNRLMPFRDIITVTVSYKIRKYILWKKCRDVNLKQAVRIVTIVLKRVNMVLLMSLLNRNCVATEVRIRCPTLGL
jgi:hypothetical protein